MKMSEHRTKLLNESEILAKIKRMAYEIVEQNFRAKELVFLGVEPRGIYLSKMLAESLLEISPSAIKLTSIRFDDETSIENCKTFLESINDIEEKTVVLIDDVANSGKTLAHSLKTILDFKPAKIQIAVLVDRMHKDYPIVPDFVGLRLSTTIQDYIEVDLEKDMAVYLV